MKLSEALGTLEDSIQGTNSCGHSGWVTELLEELYKKSPELRSLVKDNKIEISYDGALEVLQLKGSDLVECSECGWVAENSFEGLDEPLCSDCSQEEE